MSARPPRFNFLRLVKMGLKHHPYRTIITITVFAIMAGTIFSAQYLTGGAEQGFYEGTSWMHADLIVVPEGYVSAGENIFLTGNPGMFFFNDSGFERISSIRGVAKASPEIFVATLSGQSCCSGYVQIIALDPERDFTLSEWLKENPDVRMEKDDIIVGSRIDGDRGSELKFYGHSFRIAGKLEPIGMQGIDSAVFTRIEDTYTMAEESGVKAVQPLTIPRGSVSSVLIRLDEGASAEEVANEIDHRIPGTRTITQNALLSTVTLNLAGVTRFLYDSAILVMIISIPLLGIVSVIIARQLRQEIALLGSLGATKEFIIRLIFTEAFSSSVIGIITGIGIAEIILISFQDFIAYTLKIPFAIPSPLTLLVAGTYALFISLVIGAVASIYPTLQAIRSETRKRLTTNYVKEN